MMVFQDTDSPKSVVFDLSAGDCLTVQKKSLLVLVFYLSNLSIYIFYAIPPARQSLVLVDLVLHFFNGMHAQSLAGLT